MYEETEDVRPIIDRYGNDAMPGHVLAVVARLRTISVLETAAEYVNQDPKLLQIPFRRRPNVQVKAVLTHAATAEPVVRAGSGPLQAPGSEFVGIAGSAPILQRLGFAPAKGAHRRLRERNSLEAAHAVLRGRVGFQKAV